MDANFNLLLLLLLLLERKRKTMLDSQAIFFSLKVAKISPDKKIVPIAKKHLIGF
jgi:hypothetical protein